MRVTRGYVYVKVPVRVEVEATIYPNGDVDVDLLDFDNPSEDDVESELGATHIDTSTLGPVTPNEEGRD